MPMTGGQRGASLVEIIVALAISTIAVLGLAAVYKNFMQAKKQLDQRAELEDYKLIVRTNLRCRETLAALGGCTPGKDLGIRGAYLGTNLLIRPDGSTTVGPYKIRAKCMTTNPKEWKVTYTDTSASGPPNPQDLFVPPLGCP